MIQKSGDGMAQVEGKSIYNAEQVEEILSGEWGDVLSPC